MKNNSLLRSLLSVSGMTLVSRVIGFLRDMIVAFYFGAGATTDAFYVAYKLPNMLRRTFAEGAFSQAFVPILAEYKTRCGMSETRAFVSHVAGFLALVLIVFVVLGMVFSGTVILITAPGFSADPAKLLLTSKILKIIFPYILLISLTSLMSGVLNTWKVFSIPAFTPTLLNVSFIVFALFFRNYFHPPILAMAWAVTVGGIVQLGFQLPYLKKIGMPFMPRITFKDKAVWRVIKLMGPAIFGTSVAQISLVINTIFASFLPSGSVSWMYSADRLMEFPTGVLGVALGTILLPSLSKHASAKDTIMFSRTLDWGIKLCLLLALPATVGLALLAKPLTMTLFMHGKFNLFDAAMTSHALIAYSFGLMGLILVKVFAPGFYAHQNIRTPVKISLFVLVCVQLMNLAFIGPLKHAGLALSIGLGSCINAGLLIYYLIKSGTYKPNFAWKSFIFKVVAAVVLMATSIILSLNFMPLNFVGETYLRVLSLLEVLGVAVIVYFIGLFGLGFRVSHFTFHE